MKGQSPEQVRQIAGVAALNDPGRRALYEYVVAQDHAVHRDEAARVLGVSRNLARFHLDKLVEEGLLEVAYRRLTGRTGPGAGRPSKLYRRSAGRIDLSYPPRRYEFAARLFAEALAEETAPVARSRLQETAYSAGAHLAEQGRRMTDASDNRRDQRERIKEILRLSGYEPYDAEDGAVRLRNCPFHELSADYRELVCGTNLSLLQGLAAGCDLEGTDVALDPRPGECCVVYRGLGIARPA